MLLGSGGDEDPLRAGEATVQLLSPAAVWQSGASAPAEIALSIVAEMRAVLEGRRGGMLRERRGSIHGGGDGESVRLTEEQSLTAAVA